MANTKIRGITIEISADTNPLIQDFKKVSGSLKDTEKYLGDINKLLKFNPQDVNLLNEKQKALAEAVSLTTNKLSDLRKVYDTLPKGENGELTEEQKKLQQEINVTQGTLEKYKKQVREVTAELDSMGNETDQVEKETKERGEETKTFGALLKANLTRDAIKGLATSIVNLGKQMFDLGKETRAYADNVMQLSTQYGLTTDKIQEFQYMSELTDTSLETITGSMTKLTKNMQTATKGTGDAYARFEKLGISVTDTEGNLRSTDEVFADAISRLGNVENATERDALAMNIFGKSAMDLNPLIAVGREGLADYRAEAHEMGYVLDTDTLESLGAVDDAMQRANKRLDAVKNQIGRYLAPIVAQITEAFAEWRMSVDWQQVGQVIKTTMGIIGKAIKGLIDIFKTVIDVGKKVADTLKDIFTGNFKFPHIPLPHFSIYPQGWKISDLLSGTIPSLKIDWYAKAMDKGIVLDGATIFGMNANGQLMGGGEKGREIIIGEKSLMNAIRNASGHTWNVNIVVNESANAKATASEVMNILELNVAQLERRWR